MKLPGIIILLILSNIGISQSSCLYLKGYINPVSKQINNSFNYSVFDIDEDLVSVDFINSNNFPEFGLNFGLEKGNNLFELGLNYYQFNYTFITTTKFPFKDENYLQRKLFANTLGIRFNYGRKLKWNTSVHLLAELSIPVKTNHKAPSIDKSTIYLSNNSIINRTESMTSNGKDPFFVAELYFNTTFTHGFYLKYGLKFPSLDPYALYYQKIDVTDVSGQTNTVLNMNFGHEQVFLYVGLGIKLDFQ